MRNCIVNNNCSIVGWLSDHDNTILGKDGNIKFYLYGNKLVSKKDGKVYTVQNDGRIIDSCNMQIGFFQGFTNRVHTATYSSSSTQPGASYPAEGLKTAGAALTKSAKRMAESFKVSASVRKIGIITMIFVVLACMITPLLSGIKGTWVVDKVIVDGVTYTVKEYENAMRCEVDYEIHIGSRGAVTINQGGMTTPGTCYKRSGNTYIIAFQSIEAMLYNQDSTITLEKKNGKLYWVEDDFIAIFKKR